MTISLAYLILRRVLELVVLRFRSNAFEELEIVVLRHELAVLQRRTCRPVLTTADRVFLAAASDDAASIYRALGFERVGTACILESRSDD